LEATSGKRKSRRSGFLEDYRLDGAYLVKPDRASGRPGIIEGTGPDGEGVLIKTWPRNPSQNDEDLAEIWRHELRQLHRLYGYPGSADLIAPLKATGADASGFYLILDPGSRRPLATLMQRASANHWLKQPRNTVNRIRIWANLKRIAQALESLHNQGLLHRNLDDWSVLTSGSEEPDFQLTGFEWSVRVAAVGNEKDRRDKVRAEHDRYVSFRRDWGALGWLAIEMMGVAREKISNLNSSPSSVSDHLIASEVRLLRHIASIEPILRLDGEVICNSIDELIADLGAEAAGRDAKHHLVIRLGAGTRFSDEIRRITDGEIEADDLESQLAFVRDDLNARPLLMAVRYGPDMPGFRLVLRGQNICYRLTEYRHPKHPTASSWEFAQTDNFDANPPASVNVLGQISLDPQSLELLSPTVASQSYPRMRGKLASWDQLRKGFELESAPPTEEARFRRALCLSQLLEMAFAAADVFPVQISRSGERDGYEGGVFLSLRIRSDTERENLSRVLGLRSLSERLTQMLTTDDQREESYWTLTDIRQLGERGASDTEWRFYEVQREGSAPHFVFSGPGPVPVLDNPFLVPSGAVGQNVQFRRRLKALRSLGEHTELLRMLVDPRRRIFESHDKVVEDEAFGELDEPKKAALREAVSTMPIYMVQGPPGVGKTYLVRELVRRRFGEEPTTRLLLTAQSNAAIDHLMNELDDTLSASAGHPPLVVRCRSKDKIGTSSNFEIGDQADRMLDTLIGSPLFDNASAHLKTKLESMRRGAAAPSARRAAGQSPEYSKRAFEALILRAANVVFSTTNSGEIERLIDERGQFDWSIVEEAGKATGGELLSPLLLSHRRLMIGDHKQLPPYRSDEMRELLSDPAAIREIVGVAGDFISRSLRDPDMEELLDEIDEEGVDLAPLCADAINSMMLFETLVEKEFARQVRAKSARPTTPIARRLETQHRMHPAIAKVVSHAFYDDSLETDKERTKKFGTETPPILTTDEKKISKHPIVVVEMPYLQEQIGKKVGDQRPPWRNSDEVTAVIDALSYVRVDPTAKKPPTLTVLSPYARQVAMLDREIESARSSRLPHLSAFVPATKAGSFCSTVDSFQGSEADLVIVSLVRNNQHTSPEQALGFLRDSRRMNVLLSRAKWKLILVGSIRFLEVIYEAMSNDEKEKYRFLQKLLESLQAGKKEGEIAFVGPATLGGRP
jgi:DNA polymerase III delta prime subunit